MRVVEAYGISTVSLSINRQVSQKVIAPRTAFVRFPHGASLGEPGNRNQQFAILRDLLLLLQTAEEPGLIVNLPYRWRRSTYDQVDFTTFITTPASQLP